MQSPGEVSLDDMKRCVEMGVYIEHVYLATLMGPQAHLGWMKGWRHVSMDMYAQAIKALGADHCVMATDLGQYLNPTPTDGLERVHPGHERQGITDDQINLMVRKIRPASWGWSPCKSDVRGGGKPLPSPNLPRRGRLAEGFAG
jgi:hypothetical protein